MTRDTVPMRLCVSSSEVKCGPNLLRLTICTARRIVCKTILMDDDSCWWERCLIYYYCFHPVRCVFVYLRFICDRDPFQMAIIHNVSIVNGGGKMRWQNLFIKFPFIKYYMYILYTHNNNPKSAALTPMLWCINVKRCIISWQLFIHKFGEWRVALRKFVEWKVRWMDVVQC